MEMLQLNDLHKTFNPGTVNEKVALNGVSLHMEAGDFATIVGSNGAGKSTLFNAITGGFIADEGSIVLGGQDITFEPEHQRSKVIGHLFQDPLKGTAPNMTIEENLALAYLRAGTAPHAIFSRISRKDKELFREKLSLLDMGLEDRMKQPVGLLSGGQRQALTLLMATLVTPKLLLLDEHTAALDPATAEKVLELTRNIVAEKKITCLMVTHNMHQALELGNRTLMMDAGRVVFDVQGEERSRMTVDDLLEKFRENAGKTLYNNPVCYAIAPPPCLTSSVRDKGVGYVFSFVNEDDVVPRLSKDGLLDCIKLIVGNCHKKRGWFHKAKKAVKETYLSMFGENGELLNMYLPGSVYYLHPCIDHYEEYENRKRFIVNVAAGVGSEG